MRARLSITIASPSPASARTGNATTARRWLRILRELGHRAVVTTAYRGADCDVLLALHARKSAAAVQRFAQRWPGRPVIVGLAGTDLYGDIRTSPSARASLETAARLVLLQPYGIEELPEHLHDRVHVIYQSVPKPKRRARRLSSAFEVLVAANLRPVKDPFRAAMAVRRLPDESRLRITHLGVPLARGTEERALAEAARNPRYRWLGTVTPGRVMQLMTRARAVCLTSRQEGGANVVSEAVTAGTPVLASEIAGSVGLLGEDYPGYFPAGDTAALRELLLDFEGDAALRRDLASRCRALAPLFTPARERDAWRALLRGLAT